MAVVLFDTNILIDHTLGIMAATRELAGYDDGAISTINWIEVAFGGAANPSVRVPYKNIDGVITEVLPPLP